MSNDRTTPTVLIAGASIGGLMLGALLERTNIKYHIYERATELRALGSVLAIGANILPVFEQLGLLEEIENFSLPCPSVNVYRTDLSPLGSFELIGREGPCSTGYNNLIFARPQLYELLRKQVPAHKISLGKKIISTEEKDNKVYIHCSDSTNYEGDILVGSDGAYSGVRQSMYKSMDEKGLLPREDLENFSIGYVCMLGVATPENPEKYTQLKDNFAHFSTVLGGDNKAWNVTNVPNNQACWVLTIQLTAAETNAQRFKNSEWGPETNEAMIKEFQDLPSPFGGTMKEFIDATPKDLISKVFLEEKVFKTWHHGRTVLIGDACHKMLPTAGQGATNAMQDAVVLANCLYNIHEYTPENLTKAFEEYYKQRHHRTKELVEISNAMAKIMVGQSWTERIIRHVVFNFMPRWIHQKGFAKTLEYRPQIAWLPLVANRGTVHVIPQEGLKAPEEEKQAKYTVEY
ncbi:hypothetical protein BGX27_011224 [Mortierella sp. AM989]|nr:hypothetical protein BGX27_011224 [Mortierella sp. AM989]